MSTGLSLVAKVQVARWDRALRHVEDEQRRTLQAIVRRSAVTSFGRRHDLGRVKDYESYVRHVPVGDYDTFSPFIERMRRGERNLLVPEPVRYFGNSSGSSDQGRSKFLPVTERQIRFQQKAGADTLMRYIAWSGDRTFLSGFTLGLFPPITMKKEGSAFITSNPALMFTRMPAITRPVWLPDDACRRMTNYDEKLTAIAERHMDFDVVALSGTTCWFPLMLERLLSVAERRGRRAKTVSDVWPNLRVLLGGGVSAAPYLPVLRRLIGRDDVVLVDTYNATEGGIYAASDHSGERGMLVLPHRGTFFEFVPLESHDEPGTARVPLWAVERDRPYAIVVTTSAGLFSYKLGDIVRFPTTDPPRMEFMGRLSGCLSVTQELTTHVEIERAVAHAVRVCPCAPLEFGAAADIGVEGTTKSRYVLYVEFETGAEPASMAAFAAAFDDGLKEQNRVYREHREVALLPPIVLPLAAGGAKRFMEEVTRGNLQGKFPRILDEAKKAKVSTYVRTAG